MKTAYFGVLAFALWMFAVCKPAFAQDPNQIHIDDSGKVLPEHQLVGP